MVVSERCLYCASLSQNTDYPIRQGRSPPPYLPLLYHKPIGKSKTLSPVTSRSVDRIRSIVLVFVPKSGSTPPRTEQALRWTCPIADTITACAHKVCKVSVKMFSVLNFVFFYRVNKFSWVPWTNENFFTRKTFTRNFHDTKISRSTTVADLVESAVK